MHKYLITVIFFLASFFGFSQNVDLSKLKGELKKHIEAKPFEYSGSVAVTTNTVFATGESGSQPFVYVATGNVLFKIYGYDLPFSFTYSNKKFDYTNPSFRFNKASFVPKFKNLGLSIGDFSMSFSPYTLSGFQCMGGGINLTPGKFKIQALYGRFLLPVGEDTSGRVKPSYQRMGYGLNVGYTGEKYKMGMSVFAAKDDAQSIIQPTLEVNRDVRPKENVSLSANGGFPIGKNLTLEGEVAISVMTENSLTQEKSPMTESPFKFLVKDRNVTTSVYHAMKTSLNYSIEKNGTIGLNYERVEPDYHTLGGYFFANDFENITLNAQHQGKVNMGLNTGLQYDNLANTKQIQSGRMVIASNLSFKPTEKVNVSMNYSNFQSFTFIQTGFEKINRLTPFENLDTLSFTQLSQNASANVNMALRQDSIKSQTLNMMMSFMESANQRNSATPQLNNGSKFINGAAQFSMTFVPKTLTLAAGLNLSLNYAGQSNTLTIGPNVTAAKQFFDKKLNATATVAYNVSSTKDISNHVVTTNIGVNTKIKKKHNLTLNIAGQQRVSNKTSPLLNFSINTSYNYNF